MLLLAPPLAFAVLATRHPMPDVEPDAVMKVATWFATFHVLQLVMVGLVGITVLILAQDFGVAEAWWTWLGVGTFLVFFSAYDSVAGIATGLAMRTARDLPPEQQAGIWETVKDWPGWDPPVFTLNVIGTLGWVVAVVGLALVARKAGARRAEWIFILLAGIFLMGGHPFPFGTIAFGCLFLAAVFHVRGQSATRDQREAIAGTPDAAVGELKSAGP
jgi:hypothetical protein